jgi:hypothetical protein
MKIDLPLSIGGYAIVKPGESPKAAWVRGMERKLSIREGHKVGLYCENKHCWTEDRERRVTSKTYQFTFCGPKSKTGGYPVVGEYYSTFSEE